MNNAKRRDIALLILTVLTVYFPSVTNTINSVDDSHIIRVYSEAGLRTLRSILIPSDQFYFRPLVELTYYLDNLLWGLDPLVMHLENVLLHLVNVIMVYLLASRVSPLTGNLPYLQLISALLFAVHPVNTEAVSWIAGRTDPLAAFFVLLSLYYLLKFIDQGLLRDFSVSLMVLLLALLAKETSIMLLPVSAALVWIMRLPDETSSPAACTIRKKKAVTAIYLLLCGALGGYAAVRLLHKPAGSVNAFSVLFQESRLDLNSVVVDTLVTTGFYLKKFFLPFPLNFAIVELNLWYLVPGIAALLITWRFFRQRTVLLFFMVAGLIFLVPSVVVRLAGLNWTPVAERYLYIPTAFMAIAVSGMVIRWMATVDRKRLTAAFFIGVLVFFAGASFHRNLIWRDNLSLFRDAVAKSPEFGDIHNELGVALVRNGDCKTARQHFELAMKRSNRPVIRELAELNMLNCNMEGKALPEKRMIMRRYVASRQSVQPELLRMLRNVTYEILRTEPDADVRNALAKETISLNDMLFQMVRDPYCLYSNGQLMLTLGDKLAALAYFRRTITYAPADAYYYEPAKTLVDRLK